MENKLKNLREQRSKLLEQWRMDKRRRFEILAAIMDIDYEISKEQRKVSGTYH